MTRTALDIALELYWANESPRAEGLLTELIELLKKESTVNDFKQYRRKQIAELREWQPGDDLAGVSVSAEDDKAGSPKLGDMIARNPKNHADKWLVAAAYFADNFEPVE